MSLLDFSGLKAELVRRGAQDDDDRNGRWINMAYRLIVTAYDWPFTILETTGATSAGSVTVGSNFRKVLTVTDKNFGDPGRPLKRISPEELSEQLHVRDFGLTGNPEYWYYDPANGMLKTFPVGGTIHVRYLTRLDPLVNAADLPLLDEAYQFMIVDRAMVEVYYDMDNVASATGLMQKYTNDMAKMAADYNVISRTHTYIDVGDPYDG